MESLRSSGSQKRGDLGSKLHEMLGRMFRHFIWSDEVTITVNKAVPPIDPLFKMRVQFTTVHANFRFVAVS